MEHQESLLSEPKDRLDVRTHLGRELPREGETYRFERRSAVSGSFSYCNVKSGAFWPADYFLHDSLKSDDMVIQVAVKVGLGNRYDPMDFVLSGANSSQFWRSINGHELEFRRDGDDMYLVLHCCGEETGGRIKLVPSLKPV